MIKFIKNFHKDEDGAVTVDWVVLTAAIVGLGIAACQQPSKTRGVNTLASSISSGVENQDVDSWQQTKG